MPYKDPEKKREHSRKYYEANKEKKREHSRKYYEANKEKKREYSREYREANKEKRREYGREYREANVEMVMWHNSKNRAKKKGLPFDLTIEDLEIPEKCPILGLELKVGLNSSLEISPSLDRIVPELGYVKGNIRVISHRANRLKSDACIEELEAILKYMKEHERDSI